jgi:nucleoside-diphosphate-sugar epimerase
MRYVVTGAAGFIGSHLAESLQERGHDVVGLDSFTDYYDTARKEENARRIDVRRVDLAEDVLDFDGLDGVFHLAGRPGVRSFGTEFGEYVRDNLLATQRLLEAAVAAGVRVVFASSSSVYGDAETYPTPEKTPTRPISPYGITKLGGEHLARAYATSFGLDAVVLRYFTVFGPRQRPDMAFTRMVEALAARSTWELYGDGTRSRSFTYVSDAVDATVAAMERGSGTYNVGGGEEATLNDAIGLLERISGRTLDVRRVPEAAGDVKRTKADVTRIRSELAWEPRVALADGLRSQLEWAFGRVGAR